MPMDVHAALRNVLSLLQDDPSRYRLFGVYWWPVKKLLRGAGYTRDNLYMLGDYQDPESAEQVPPAGLEETLRAAFETYGQNARYPHADGRMETPDGELAMIFDEDARR